MRNLTATLLFFISLAVAGQASLSYRQGLESLNKGKYEEAVSKFKTAIDQNPNYQDAW